MFLSHFPQQIAQFSRKNFSEPPGYSTACNVSFCAYKSMYRYREVNIRILNGGKAKCFDNFQVPANDLFFHFISYKLSDLFCFVSPVIFTPPVTNYLLFFSTLLCKKSTCGWGRKKYILTDLEGQKQKRSNYSI